MDKDHAERWLEYTKKHFKNCPYAECLMCSEFSEFINNEIHIVVNENIKERQREINQ